MPADEGDILLSIAIPTKNRQQYILNLLNELVVSKRDDFEIIVQDNSEDDRLSASVAALNDPRIRYAYHGAWLSVVDNCDAAVAACSGHYVCMLGDDDGILLNEALDVLAQARNDDIDALMGDVLLYVWPDLSHQHLRNFGGKLHLKPMTRHTRGVNTPARIHGVVKRCGAFGLEGLACVYQGFVRRAVLDRLRQATGSCFPGPSPDMANAIGICPFVERSRYVPRALVIAGHSRGSGAGRGTMKQHRGAITAQTHLPDDTVEKWFRDIPFFWSGPTIYAQSLRSAIARLGTSALGKPGNACLYAACFLFEPSYARETWRALKQSGEPMWTLVPCMIYYALLILLKRAAHFGYNLSIRIAPTRAAIAADSIAEAIQLVRSRLAA